jgi:hypothetical protein
LALLLARDGEFAVLNGDSHALACLEPGVLDPSPGELDPRKSGGSVRW